MSDATRKALGKIESATELIESQIKRLKAVHRFEVDAENARTLNSVINYLEKQNIIIIEATGDLYDHT